MAERILIYRLGSLGDTIVALPSFRLVARAFPEAKRVLLTMIPRSKEAEPETILKGMGLVDGYMAYNPGERSYRNLWTVSANIRRFGPDVLIYMNQSRGTLKDLRDLFFFRVSGVRSVIGAPRRTDLTRHRFDPALRLFESEAHRIARCLSALGDAHVEDPASWDLGLTAAERAEAEGHLEHWLDGRCFIAINVGSKIAAKDWGEPRWRSVVQQVGKDHANIGLAFIGGLEDRERSDRVAKAWSSPPLNLCGMLTPRISAAVLARATMFVGGDSGPMHLASSVGTRCVAIFGSYNRPGIWYPVGLRHSVIREADLALIKPDRVINAVNDLLTRSDPVRRFDCVPSSA